MFVVKGTVGGKEIEFSFKPMSPTETALWGGKLQARVSYANALQKEIQLVEETPPSKWDPDVYLKMKDTFTRVKAEVVTAAEDLAGQCVNPSPEVMRGYLRAIETAEDATKILMKYITSLVPTGEETKKS